MTTHQLIKKRTQNFNANKGPPTFHQLKMGSLCYNNNEKTKQSRNLQLKSLSIPKTLEFVKITHVLTFQGMVFPSFFMFVHYKTT